MNLITEPKQNLSDFERLIFAQAYIKELKGLLSKAEIEIGMLKSELEELKAINNNTKRVGEYKRIVRETTAKLSSLKKDHQRLLSDYITIQRKYNEI